MLLPTLGLVVVLLAVYAIYRRSEVRLTLLLAALALGVLAGDPVAILRKFLTTFSDEQFVVPICTAMGFAYVLKHTGCDQHLVHLLVRYLVRIRFLLIPGTVLVGFFVNMPIVSQTSTAVTIGPVLIPILQAARISPVTIGGSILLGSSIGGELLNPGAPELQTVIVESKKAAGELEKPYTVDPELCVRRVIPLVFPALAAATALFWLLTLRREHGLQPFPVPATPSSQEGAVPFKVNLLMALVPLLPLVFLYLVSFARGWLPWEMNWLEEIGPKERLPSRRVGLAMVLGAAVAALVVWRKAAAVGKIFFEGAGYGFTHIISLIVTASCFGEGIKLIGLDLVVGEGIKNYPGLLMPLAGLLPLGFGALSGSGMATTQSLFHFFAEPALLLNVDPAHVGAVVSIAAAAGRTMSPVAAVTLMTAALTGTNPFDLVKRVALPLMFGVFTTVLVAMAMAPPV